MQQIEEHCQNVSCILVGNKCDLTSKRAVSQDEGQELADHYMIRYVETSAKDSTNVESAFTLMTSEIINKVAVAQPSNFKPTKVLGTENQIEVQKPSCC